MINFISNLPKELVSGGFSAVNAASYAALENTDNVHYVGPINPPPGLWQKALSKSLRLAGLPGDFFFFSQERLRAIAAETEKRCQGHAAFDFFHGFTPWISTAPARPYVAWSDCTFQDYIEIYHDPARFRQSDLKRIKLAEASWLGKAQAALFSTRWAAERAIRDYGIDPENVYVTGVFGELGLPERDVFSGSKEFAFVATNFAAKGGYRVLEAIRQARRTHPDVALTVIGPSPPDVSNEPGITFAGFLRKEIPEQYERYRTILSRARALLHPSTSDVCPLAIIEAGYLGCPAIASRLFAIPELIDDRHTGILLDDPSSANSIAAAISWTLDHEGQYLQMRKAAWAKMRSQHSKASYSGRLRSAVKIAMAKLQQRRVP